LLQTNSARFAGRGAAERFGSCPVLAVCFSGTHPLRLRKVF
jgi:hypothetical protein